MSEEIDQVRQQYDSWGLDRTIRSYPWIEGPLTTQQARAIDWDKRKPESVLVERFLRHDGRFFSELTQPKPQRRVIAYDGKLSRYRNSIRLHNGPVDQLTGITEDSVSSPLPHTMLLDFYTVPGCQWLYGIANRYESFFSGVLTGKVRISEVEYDDHPCWKVNFTLVKQEFGGSLTFGEVLLARDRSLIPVYQVFRTPLENSDSEVKEVFTDEIVFDEAMNLWIPTKIFATSRHSDKVQVSLVRFRPCSSYAEKSVYTDVGVVAPKHEKPAKPSIPEYAPEPILSQQIQPTFSILASQRESHHRIIINALIGIGLMVVAVVFSLQKTRIGHSLRRLVANHPMLMDAIGLFAALGIAYVCSIPPGWQTYGLTMMLVGIFGLSWLMFSLLVIGDKTISIRVALYAAACMAVFFAGYNQGIKRMQVRQRMIQEVRADGGHVAIGSWHLEEDGLYLPKIGSQILGEAWSGRANHAAVEQSAFTPANVDRWCLDELQWLGVGSDRRQPFRVDSNALANINSNETLWTFHAEEGYIDGKAFNQLARFERLTDLHFDCQGLEVAPEIAKLPDLERLWLSNVVVNDLLIERLSSIENLEYLTLILPSFDQLGENSSTFQIDGLTIQYANLTPEALGEIGQIPTKLTIENCTVSVPQSTSFSMPETTQLQFRTCKLDDRCLTCFSETPRLKSIKLIGTGVSVRGVESYSKQCPDVLVTLE